MKNIFLTLLIIFSLLLLMTGCASNQKARPNKNIEIEKVFNTEIQPDGLKIFSYTEIMQMPNKKRSNKKSRGMHSERMGGSMHRPDREAMQEERKNTFYENLHVKLAETAYCRDGYVETKSSFERGISRIEGSCVDTAIEDDL